MLQETNSYDFDEWQQAITSTPEVHSFLDLDAFHYYDDTSTSLPDHPTGNVLPMVPYVPGLPLPANAPPPASHQ